MQKGLHVTKLLGTIQFITVIFVTTYWTTDYYICIVTFSFPPYVSRAKRSPSITDSPMVFIVVPVTAPAFARLNPAEYPRSFKLSGKGGVERDYAYEVYWDSVVLLLDAYQNRVI